MPTENLLQLGLHLLPSLAVFILAFVAAADRRTKDHWSNLLYQLGSIRNDQKSDPKIQRSVRWPFLLVAVVLLIWPINYYRHATRVFEISPSAYGTNAEKFNPYASNTASGASDSNVANSVTPGATSTTPAPSGFNPYASR